MCNKPVSGAPLLEEACQLGSMVNSSHRRFDASTREGPVDDSASIAAHSALHR
ncbi:hypothetical protein R16034_02116 [Ralstonia edaphis]|uniref:Uncharacterized protein n=1 Tax=Ralstonia edaphi TaxID=3058599 RepID=A0AB72X0F1_9RALS|nr:hypothetical protein R16034_02116 [Ralstonia sp. LMG 6871]